MRGQRRKCGQNCGKYSSYQPERQGVRARLGQTQCAGPLVKAEADFVVHETFYSSMKMGDEIVKALGASVQELRAVRQSTRRRQRTLRFGNCRQRNLKGADYYWEYKEKFVK